MKGQICMHTPKFAPAVTPAVESGADVSSMTVVRPSSSAMMCMSAAGVQERLQRP